MRQVESTAEAAPTSRPPRCTAGRHRWTADHTVVGGMESNPGVWGIGGIDWVKVEACARCGCGRRTVHTHDGHRWTVRVWYVPGQFSE